MTDPYKAYMTMAPEIEYHDCAIEDFTLEAFAPFLSEGGCFDRNIDFTVRGKKEFTEVSVFSATAKYESDNGGIAAAQLRIIDAKGKAIYYSPVYEIGSSREFYRREWRLPPTIDRYDTVRLSLIIPQGVRLYFRNIRIKHNTGYRERDIGIRYHGHGGCTSAFGMQLTAEVGFTSCITIPKFTKDGVPVCLHDDETVIKELRLDDRSMPEEGGRYDKPVSELTYAELLELNVWNRRSDIFTGMRVPTMEEYFRICSSTGMQPIFSVHPDLTREQWLTVRDLLIKYRLLEHFWVKGENTETHAVCREVFGGKIAGHIVIFGSRNYRDPLMFVTEAGLDPSRDRIVIEFFDHIVTEEQLKTARDEGFVTSIAAMKGGISGIRMQYLIDQGVTEFTVDRHCSMGLSW